MTTNEGKDFLPECYIDTNLVETLLNLAGHQPKDGVNHRRSCNEVTKTMEEKYCGEFAVGIIDDDKRKPTEYSKFRPYAESAHIRLMKHTSQDHYLIVIHRAMEDFILSCIDGHVEIMSECGLPYDMEELKDETKNAASKKDRRFKDLFKKIRESPEMVILRNVLDHLYKCKRNADMETLQSFFPQAG